MLSIQMDILCIVIASNEPFSWSAIDPGISVTAHKCWCYNHENSWFTTRWLAGPYVVFPGKEIHYRHIL